MGKIGKNIAIATLLLVTACHAGRNFGTLPSSDDADTLLAEKIRAIKEAFERQDAVQSLNLSRELRNFGKTEGGGEKAGLYGLVYLAQSHYLTGSSYDSLSLYIDEAREEASRQKDYWALATIQNVVGSYALFVELDYGKGLSNLMEGLRYAEMSGDASRIFPLKSNIALAYYFRNDPAGLQYALEVHDLGRQYGNEFMVFTGAVISSYMYYVLGQYDRALEYIRYALPLARAYSDERGVYSLYGDILMALGRREEAAESYRKAIAEGSDSGRFSDVDAYLGYGRYLQQNGRYEEALRIMEQGISVAEMDRRSQKLYLLYYNLSSLYESLYKPAAALKYYKMYHAKADSMFNIEQEKAIAELKIQNEKERYENELRVQDLTWQKRLQVVVLILLIVVILAIGAFILYYRKERGYRQILKLRQEAAEKEKWYRTQLQKYSREPEQGIVYHTETEQDDKLYELFTRLQTLMSEQKIYMRPDLSRDAVAKLLSTNRTYLSEAISRYTGLSFVYYVNSFRIDAAVRILSDPNDETPIKALVHELGFHSMSTFYRLFQAAKGVPPSQFREQRKRHA